MARVLIVDESPLVRYGLRSLLDLEGLEVVDEVDNGIAALESVTVHDPEYVILELSTPMLGGLNLITRLQNRKRSLRILVLTSLNAQHYAGRCLQAGALGFLGKQEPLSRIRTAIASLIEGRSYFSIDLLNHRGDGEGDAAELSNRELTVLQMLMQGKRICEIASQLMISQKTVSTHKLRVMQKMKVNSFVELVQVARQKGFRVDIDI